jgi:PAS domain S-box-containing protein
MQDIWGHAEERLRKERVMRDLTALEAKRFLDLSIDLFCISDFEGRLTYLNPAWEKTLGFSRTEILRKNSYLDLVHPDDRAQTLAAAAQLYSGQHLVHFENRYLCSDGSYKSFRWNATPSPATGEVHGVARDVTVLNNMEIEIRNSLQEKEMLLRELQHRVRNNMHVMYSVVSLQLRRIQDKKYQELLREVQSQVRTMALVHERVYQSNALGDIALPGYVDALLDKIRRDYDTESKKIDIRAETQDLPVSTDLAMICGLILNELVSNAVKHAFRGRKSGKIEVSIAENLQERIELTVRDNGIGFDTEVTARPGTLGLELVAQLVRELNATMKHIKRKGSEFVITFKRQSTTGIAQ